MQSLRIQLPDIKDNGMENLIWERELLGVYISGHPIHACGIAYENFDVLDGFEHKYALKPLVMVVEVKEHQAKSGKMAFLKVEDHKMRQASAVIFPRQYRQHREILEVGNILYLDTKVDTTRDEPGLIIENVAKWGGKGWVKK
jgi:DNA polymerase-3 subunit alpha